MDANGCIDGADPVIHISPIQCLQKIVSSVLCIQLERIRPLIVDEHCDARLYHAQHKGRLVRRA